MMASMRECQRSMRKAVQFARAKNRLDLVDRVPPHGV
jgi:hypothetical protein